MGIATVTVRRPLDRGYRERPPRRALTGVVARSWISVNRADQPVVRRVLPDASADIMWIDGALIVAGPDTQAVLAPLPAGAQVAAVRFRPGLAPALLGKPASEIQNQRLTLNLFWGSSATTALGDRLATVADQVGDSGGASAVVNVLEAAIEERLAHAPPPDRLIEGLVARLRRHAGPVRVGALAWELGVSERHLLRRCAAAVGYGPKMLHKILRLQHFLDLAARSGWSLAELAGEAGFADQSHLTRECRELTGLTPAALLAERAVTRTSLGG